MKYLQLVIMDGIIWSVMDIDQTSDTYLLWSQHKTVNIPRYYLADKDTRNNLGITIIPYIETEKV